MTPRQQQVRRRELHDLKTPELQKLYAKKSGHLLFEVKNMFRGLTDDGRQIMVDSIIQRESRA
jgi:hypothetical protein